MTMASLRSTWAAGPIMILLCIVLTAGCRETPEGYTMNDFSSVKKIDAHVHDNSDSSAFEMIAVANNFRILSINVDYPDFPSVEVQRAAARGHLARHPELFAFASTFRLDRWDSSDWVEYTIRSLDSTFVEGAIAVKTWNISEWC